MSAVIDLSRMQSSRGRLPFLLRGQDGRITRAKTRNDFERELDQIRATGSAQERPDSQLLAALACWPISNISMQIAARRCQIAANSLS